MLNQSLSLSADLALYRSSTCFYLLKHALFLDLDFRLLQSLEATHLRASGIVLYVYLHLTQSFLLALRKLLLHQEC